MRFPSSGAASSAGLLCLLIPSVSARWIDIASPAGEDQQVLRMTSASPSSPSPTEDTTTTITTTKTITLAEAPTDPPQPPVNIGSLDLPTETPEQLKGTVDELNTFFKATGGTTPGSACEPGNRGLTTTCAGREMVVCGNESHSWETMRGCPEGSVCTSWVGQDFRKGGWTVMFGCEKI